MFWRMIPYLWHSLNRNRRRSVLTILGVAVAIFVFISLQAAIFAITAPTRETGSERLLNVREAARSNVMSSRLPMGFERQVEGIAGAQAATGVLSDLFVVGEERVHIFIRGIDPENYLKVHSINIDPTEWIKFQRATNGALVGHELLKRMDWQVGDVVEMPQGKLRVQIVGVIPAQGIDLEDHMLVQRKFLQLSRNADGQVSYIFVACEPDRDTKVVADTIDKTMAQSPVPTKTVSAAAYAEALIRDFMGFVGYLKLVGWIVMGITLLGAANAIGIAVRERTREIGVLRAIGFSPRLIKMLIVAESTGLSLIGGLLGGVAALLFFQTAGGDMSALTVPPVTLVLGIVLAAVIGSLSGFFPASTGTRLNIVDAIRTID